MQLRAGTCGWSYDDWKGSFYPPGCKDELAYYAGIFDCVEIDSTWYRTPGRRMVEGWQRRAPEGFTFCPKMPGEITHENLLENSDAQVDDFLDAISLLGDSLGPIVVQLGPKFTAERFETLRAFLEGLPAQFRFVVEYRHKSWLECADALPLLRELNMAVVMAHHPWYPRIEQVTCDIAYLRLMGPRTGYPDLSRIHRPRDEALQHWAGVLDALPDEVETAFVFVNNHFEGHSPRSVQRLLELLTGEAPNIPLPEEPRLDL